MAKKPPIPEDKVRCVDCKFCSGAVVNFLVDCRNIEANPGRFKKGCWEHACSYFQKK